MKVEVSGWEDVVFNILEIFVSACISVYATFILISIFCCTQFFPSILNFIVNFFLN